MRARLFICFFCWCAALGPLVALAEPGALPERQQVDPAARLAFEEGLTAYERGQFVQALPAFERAYRLSSHPKLLFNIGRAADGDAQFARAISAYQAYLAAYPSAENREFVEARIEKLSTLERQAVAPTPAPTAASLPSLRAEPALVGEPPGPRATMGRVGVDPSTPRTDGEPSRPAPLWKRGWVWGVAGGVLAVGISAAVIAGTRNGAGQPAPAVDERYMTLWRR